MHPSLYLDLYRQQRAERLRATEHRRLVARLVRERECLQLQEHARSSLLVRLGLWLRINLARQFV